jgi:hypothetical protein
MAKKWSEIESSPEYQELNDSDRTGLKQRYYTNVVSIDSDFTSLSAQEQGEVKSKFFNETKKQTLPSLDFSGTGLGQGVDITELQTPKKWLTPEDFKPTFKQELLKPENVFGTVFGTAASIVPIKGVKEAAAGLGGVIGQGLEEFVNARTPGAGEYDQEAAKGRIRDAGVRQAALEAASLPFARAVSAIGKPIVKAITKPFAKAGTKVVKDVITKTGREYAEKVVPAGMIRRAGSWIGGKFIPESIDDAARIQETLISAGSRALSPDEAAKVSLLPGDIMKNSGGTKLEGLASKGIGGGSIRKQVVERNIPAYNQATKDIAREIGGSETDILNNRELGEDIYKFTKERYEERLKPRIKELYDVAQQTIAKAGKTDVPAMDITSIVKKNVEQVSESKLFGGLGSKGMGDDIAKKISNVVPPAKGNKEALEIAEQMAKIPEEQIASPFGKMPKSKFIEQIKNDPSFVKSAIEQGLITEKDLVPQITKNVFEELGIQDSRKITFSQYEKLRQRLVQEFDDVSNSLTGDKNVLKKMAEETFTQLDDVFEKAANAEGVSDAIPQIKYAREFFSKVQELKNKPAIRNAWQLVEQQNQPESIINMLAQKDGLRTLNDAKKMLGKNAGSMMAKIRKNIFNGIVNDVDNQITDIKLGITTLNPKKAMAAFENRFSPEMQKAIYPADELAKIKLHFKLGAAINAEKFLGDSSLGGAGMVVPLVQFGSSGAGAVVSGFATGGIAPVAVGSAIALSPKAISILSTGEIGRAITNKIIELNSPKLSPATRSVLLNRFMTLVKSKPSLAAEIRIINTAANMKEEDKTQSLQKAGNQ